MPPKEVRIDPKTRVQTTPHPQAQVIPQQTLRPTSEGYDPNIPLVQTRKVEINQGPEVLVNEVERTQNRYVQVESPDYWKECYDEVLAKEVALSDGRFGPLAERIEAQAKEVHRGKLLAKKLQSS